MIYLTAEETEKIALLDKIFRVLSADDIKQLFGCDLVVGKLKGVETKGPGRLSEVLTELQVLQNMVASLQIESTSLKNDFQSLIRCLNKGMGDSTASSDFYTLKSKHGVY
jgi:hypothetical protein